MHTKSLHILAVSLLLFSCASLQKVAERTFEKPSVSVSDARITGLSFDTIDLIFDLKISNPNIIGVTLAGYDYDFGFNQKSVLQGKQSETLKIEAQNESTIAVPLTLRFRDLYDSLVELRYRDQADYSIDLGLSIDVPVLGTQHRVPVSKAGAIPLPKLPNVSVAALELNSLKVSGADLALKVRVDNPNVFDFALKSINVALQVAGAEWLNNTSSTVQRVAAKESGVLTFPISLNFFQMGRSMFQLLSSNEPIDYQLKGDFAIDTSSPLIGSAILPFEQVSKITLSK